MILSDRNQRLARRLLSLALLSMFLAPVLVGGLASPARADNPAGSTESSLELPPPPDLNELDQARKTIADMTATPPKATGKVTLVSSWPNRGARLWVPGREARLTFDQPVRPVDVTMQIAERGSGSALVVNRNFTDTTLRTIRFSVDGMRPGEYVVTWSAGESSGTYGFRMDDVPRAGGGGNHRSHAFAVLTPGLPERYSLVTLVLLLALAFVRTLTVGHARIVRAVAVWCGSCRIQLLAFTRPRVKHNRHRQLGHSQTLVVAGLGGGVGNGRFRSLPTGGAPSSPGRPGGLRDGAARIIVEHEPRLQPATGRHRDARRFGHQPASPRRHVAVRAS